MKRASSRSRWVGPPTDLTPLFSDLAHPESNALAYCDSPSDMGATGHVEAIHPLPYFHREEILRRAGVIDSIVCPCIIDRRFDKSLVGIVIEIYREKAGQFDVGEARCAEYL